MLILTWNLLGLRVCPRDLGRPGDASDVFSVQWGHECNENRVSGRV